jgi:methylenetetrahydrofolate dehydrogenase (NADP+)/methenyltetrahydrofolate cyclohydrolase
MTARVIDGSAVAAQVRGEVAEQVRGLSGRGITPGLAAVLVGDDPASHLYVRMKQKDCADVGINSARVELAAATSERRLLETVENLNSDPAVHGIIVQLPLPDQIDEARVLRSVEPIKDVDGFHPFNAGQLYLGRPTLVPATPLGIMALLAEHRIHLEGAEAVVIGRSDIVGKPIAHLLLQSNATVTICHSRTSDLARYTLEADVLVVAVGAPEVVTPDMVKQGSAVVDVGINRTDDGVVGDVAPDAAELAGFITPVPGGVGPMTIAMLLQNTVKAARYRRGVLAFPQG